MVVHLAIDKKESLVTLNSPQPCRYPHDSSPRCLGNLPQILGRERPPCKKDCHLRGWRQVPVVLYGQVTPGKYRKDCWNSPSPNRNILDPGGWVGSIHPQRVFIIIGQFTPAGAHQWQLILCDKIPSYRISCLRKFGQNKTSGFSPQKSKSNIICQQKYTLPFWICSYRCVSIGISKFQFFFFGESNNFCAGPLPGPMR